MQYDCVQLSKNEPLVAWSFGGYGDDGWDSFDGFLFQIIMKR